MKDEIPYNQRTETKACAHCGKEFTGHPDRLYCSPRCKRHTPLSREIEHVCKECKLPFIGHPSAMFCSTTCKTQFHNPHKDEECDGFNINNPFGSGRVDEKVYTTPTLDEEQALFSFYKTHPGKKPTLILKPIPGFNERAPIYITYVAYQDHDAAVMHANGDYKRLYDKLWYKTPDERLATYEQNIKERTNKVSEGLQKYMKTTAFYKF